MLGSHESPAAAAAAILININDCSALSITIMRHAHTIAVLEPWKLPMIVEESDEILDAG
jgi:hypothetical protein